LEGDSEDVAGTVTTVIMRFDLPAFPGKEYDWHCHILEHEEHDMLRSLVVI
jgi:spore coat protein A